MGKINFLYFRRTYFAPIILVFLITCKSGGNMINIHEGKPEHILFFRLAEKKMKEYQKGNGFYPPNWYLLDITFVNGPYRIYDKGISPTKEMGNRWHPKDCDYTYEITLANKDHFLIRAINQESQIEYEIDEQMEQPIRIEK